LSTDILVWLLAGCTLAWIAFSFLKWNPGRGLIVSAIIGAAAAFLGGNVLAPAFGGAINEAGGFSPFALVVAAATAIAFLKIADIVYERYRF
jgi:uncharacterized membrane protein YeaQ/YmgE (transglycosylase-associated protein family)